jgi:hypothetical protein
LENDLDFTPDHAIQEEVEAQLPDQGPLVRLRQMVDSFYSTTRTSNERAQRNFRYYNNQSISQAERDELKRRKQPEVKENLIRRAVNGLVGVAKDQSVDPRAYPRNSGSEEDVASADVASKALRFVADNARFNGTTRARAFRSMLIHGVVGCEIEWEAGEGKIAPTLILQDQIIYDPFARDESFKDASFLGHGRWGWVDDVEDLYPEAKGKLNGGDTSSSNDVRASDRPQYQWVESSALGRRVSVVTLYVRRNGQWMRAVFTETVLLEYGPSPYLCERGKPSCGMVAQCVYRDEDNNICCYVDDLIDLQDEVNKRRSKLLHLLNTRQLQERELGSFVGDAAQAKLNAADPSGIIDTGLVVVPTADMANGQAQLLAATKADFERASPNPAILGRQGADASGRAMQIRQQAGLTELEAEFSALEEFTIRCYETMWARIRQFWDGPRYIRITDDMKAAQMVQVNKPIMGIVEGIGPYGEPIQQEVQTGVENHLAQMDVDFIIDVSPNTVTLAQEQFAIMSELAKSGVFPPSPGLAEFFVRISNLPDKAGALEVLKPKEQPSPEQQMQGEAAKAEIRKTNAEAAKSEAMAAEIAQRIQMTDAMPEELPPPGISGDPAMMMN